MDYYMLQIKDDDLKPSIENAVKFKAPVTASACKSQLFNDMLTVYRYCKFNYFSFYVKAFLISYGTPAATVNPKGWVSVGVNQVIGRIPFYLSWNLDSAYPPLVTEAMYTSDPHSRIIKIGSSKAVKFMYKVPVPVKRYLSSSSVKGGDPTKDIGVFLESVSSTTNFRAPNMFNGGMTNVLKFLSDVTLDGVHGMKICLEVACYVNCTFKGRDMV